MARPYLCESCIAITGALRAFSVSAPASLVGPESPKFIEVPQPLQPRYPPQRRIKGILPVPRDLFPRRGPNKTSPEYLAAATPEPARTVDESFLARQPAETADLIFWKERMAATRRRNLREGLVELHRRKVRKDREIAKRSAARIAENQRLATKEKREDERLMEPSIPTAIKQLQKGVLPDPDRVARIEQQRIRVQEKGKRKEEIRRDALHSLYMNAGNFITTEEQLQAAVDRVFISGSNPAWYNSASEDYQPESVWGLGPPETVQQMLVKVNKTGGRALDYYQSYGNLTGQRVRKIAEELTGGRM